MTTRPIPHGTLSGYKCYKCRCLDCTDASNAYQRRRHRRLGAGVWQPFVDPTRTVAHIEALHDEGMSYKQIAKAAGVPTMTVDRIRSGRTPAGIRPTTEAVLLAVAFNPTAVDDTARIPAAGARRRLQALRAQGWPFRALARRLGVDARILLQICGQEHVAAATHRRIVELYDDVRDLDPVGEGVAQHVADRSRREARDRGFPPPAAWVDIDRDEQPLPRRQWVVRYAKAERSATVLEETEYLASFGLTRDQIAARLGVSWEAVHRAHLRAGQPLPGPLLAEVAA